MAYCANLQKIAQKTCLLYWYVQLHSYSQRLVCMEPHLRRAFLHLECVHFSLKLHRKKITKESLISIWITLHVFSCHLFIYSYPCGFHTRKVVGSSPARNIFDHKLNFSFVILFSWEPYPVWVCKKHLPVRESVWTVFLYSCRLQTNKRQDSNWWLLIGTVQV